MQIEEVPKEVQKTLTAKTDEMTEKGEIDRITNLEKGAKIWEKLQIQNQKAEEKKAEEEKKLEASTAEKATFETLSLTSMDEVKEFVKKLNTSKLIPAHKKELSDKVEKARETLKTKVEEVIAENAPETEKTEKPKTTSNRIRKTKPKTETAEITNSEIAENQTAD